MGLRELEFRWVEKLRDGLEGLGTPYFDMYFDDLYEFSVQISPSVRRNEVGTAHYRVCCREVCVH